MSVTVRLGRHEELETLIELQSAAILQSSNPAYDIEQRQLIAQHQAAVRRSSLDETILVAEHDGQVVGFSSLVGSSTPDCSLVCASSMVASGNWQYAPKSCRRLGTAAAV